MVGNLDTNSDTRVVVQGRDENSRREKWNKDDLEGGKRESLRIVIKLKISQKLPPTIDGLPISTSNMQT